MIKKNGQRDPKDQVKSNSLWMEKYRHLICDKQQQHERKQCVLDESKITIFH